MKVKYGCHKLLMQHKANFIKHTHHEIHCSDIVQNTTFSVTEKFVIAWHGIQSAALRTA